MLFFKKKKEEDLVIKPGKAIKKIITSPPAPPVQERVLTAEGWQRRMNRKVLAKKK